MVTLSPASVVIVPFPFSDLSTTKLRRIYHPINYIDIIDDKIWLQHNCTDQRTAEELIDAGIPRDKIVLGFQPPELRKYTDYGAAYKAEMA